MKMYRVRLGRYGIPDAKIREVEVEKETSLSVWIDGRRHAKRSEWANYYNSWEEAKAALLEAATDRVNSLKLELERYKEALGNIKGLSHE